MGKVGRGGDSYGFALLDVKKKGGDADGDRGRHGNGNVGEAQSSTGCLHHVPT